MDLNRLALWFAGIAAASLFWRSLRAPRMVKDWLIVSLAILLTCALGWFLFPNSEGYAAGMLTLLLVLMPSRAAQAAARASERQQYARARLFSTLAALFHPSADYRVTPPLFRAFELAQIGQLGEAEALLQVLAKKNPRVALTASAQRLRLLARWQELRALGEDQGLLALQTQPTLLALYLRALGELGQIEDLSKFMAAQETTLVRSGTQDLALLYLFAFTGHVELTARVLGARARRYSVATREFWLAVAHQNAGHSAEARLAFSRLRTNEDAQIRARAEERWSALLDSAPERQLSPQTMALVARFARAFDQKQRFGWQASTKQRPNVTNALVIVNTVIYAIGSAPRFFESREEFLTRWSFSGKDVLSGDWWRTMSYLFVHFNWLHLLMNMGGLLVLGPFVEQAYGRFRYLAIYLAAGCAGTAVYLALSLFEPSEQLVGASGCIMGLLGAHVAVMLRAWRRHRAPMAREMLVRLLFIVALQVVFDRTTPNVAGLAHAVGLAAGFLCALALTDTLSADAPRLGASLR
ncbi:MAG TPA: rhomboid family intramembrane serine protease [Polyangiaceae bacterium]|jgi:rhomboid protease GluP